MRLIPLLIAALLTVCLSMPVPQARYPLRRRILSASQKDPIEAKDTVLVRSSTMWPPWPFSLLSKKEEPEDAVPVRRRRGPIVFWSYLRTSAGIGFRQVQVVATQLWFHLPAGAPPLLLYATFPRPISIFADPFSRRVALGSLGLAILSWGHSELHRYRQQTPLPISQQIVLPPFLPEEPQQSALEKLESESSWNTTMMVQPHTWKSQVKIWQNRRRLRSHERLHAHRLAIYEEFVALQSLQKAKAHPEMRTAMGYALVTGASQGIGRAIAVELARHSIPLVLVARNIERLTALAYDLEACYGIKCCIVQADLSRPGEAERIYKATTEAGLTVDVLVNNAGVSKQGLSFDMSPDDVSNMLQLNIMSVSALTHLYGRDMKDRRRGRIMMISSICGAVAGLSSVSVYAATKAFENSLGLSLAKELEPFGVAVTTVMPGAVRDTGFRSRSESQEALCWKIPFYAKSPVNVAGSSVRAMLRGDSECTPGWMNKAFLKVLKPALPQRLHNLVGEVAWSPVPWFRPSQTQEVIETNEVDSMPTPAPKPRGPLQIHKSLQRAFKPAPMILQLDEDPKEIEAPQNEGEEADASQEPEEPSAPEVLSTEQDDRHVGERFADIGGSLDPFGEREWGRLQ